MPGRDDPFRGSVLARSSAARLAAAAAVLVALWLGIAWAVSLP